MLPDRVSNPGPLTYESGALPIALQGPAPLMKCPFQNEVYSKRKEFALLEVAPIKKTERNENSRVASPAGLRIYLKDV